MCFYGTRIIVHCVHRIRISGIVRNKAIDRVPADLREYLESHQAHHVQVQQATPSLLAITDDKATFMLEAVGTENDSYDAEFDLEVVNFL
jgi:hypothetical protein